MKVIGIGNALVDIVSEIESDNLLDKLNLPKGGMILIDESEYSSTLKTANIIPTTTAAGGSAANTINGLAKMQTSTGFIGKIGNDQLGQYFKADQLNNGIKPLLLVDDHIPTGRCISLVSPCKERTMATYLGAASTISEKDISIPKCDFLYIEGYLVNNHNLIESIMDQAHSKNISIVLDLASYNVVSENKEFLKFLVKKYVDILFANEDEAHAYTSEKDPKKSLDILEKESQIAILKVGAEGSWVSNRNERHKIGVIDATPRDKTGAGDLYAAGFLRGMISGHNLKTCGDFGAITSSKVIEVMGPKMNDSTWTEIMELLNRVEQGENIVQ